MIKIKDKDYNFKFGFKAILQYEEETNNSLSSLGDNVKMGTLVDLCYYGIVSTGDIITRDEIVDAIDEDFSLLTVINDNISDSMSSFGALTQEAKK